jgi:hypothetical protein
MRIGISSNWLAGKGLAADGRVIQSLLEKMGHGVLGWQFDDNKAGECVDLVLFLEVINPTFLKWSRRAWLVPNAEWWRPQLAYLLPRIELVLCKTRDALRLFAPLAKQVYFTGFTAEDHYVPNVKRLWSFLHNPGQSQAKNTAAVVECWRKYKLAYPLTVVGEHYTGNDWNIKYIKSVPRAELIQMKNAHLFHIMASAYEGFGISLGESISTGAVVCTGDYPPLNEFQGCQPQFRIPSSSTGKQGIATIHGISPEGVKEVVDKCWALTAGESGKISKKARQAYLDGRVEFEERFCGAVRKVSELGRKDVIDVKNLMDKETPNE